MNNSVLAESPSLLSEQINSAAPATQAEGRFCVIACVILKTVKARMLMKTMVAKRMAKTRSPKIAWKRAKMA